MARTDRCTICDYSENEGSHHLGVAPGVNGQVRKKLHGDYFCDVCAEEVNGVLREYYINDELSEAEDPYSLPEPDVHKL